MNLKTNYEVGVIPHSEHPNPQFEREDYLILNGLWNLKKFSATGEELFNGEILVPFSPETINSGLDNFKLNTGEYLEYTRKINLTKNLLKGKTVIKFGAVDSEALVYVNENFVGKHVGGFTAFEFDITSYAILGENDIKVVVYDEATRNSGARGKQSDKRGGIWYTAQSGIWQTVYIESYVSAYLSDLKISADANLKEVKIAVKSFEKPVKITVYDNNKVILTNEFINEITLNYNFTLWSPENPKLYEFTLESESGDKVKSYFGVISFGKAYDINGKLRLTLNGKPYFMNGVLDQGYWSDGMLTYPSDKAVVDELTMLKEMGFNMVRKHIKIEPMRWYYHCDKIGLIVWQDFVNGGGDYSFMHVAALPFLGFHHKDNDYKYFAREDERGRLEFKQLVDETVSQLYNVVSIGVWVVFNEGWGQFDSKYYTDYVKGLDNSRIIDSVSGWHDQGEQNTELKSLHTYYTPLKVPNDKRAVVLSEFGGYSLKTEGHVFAEKEFGYKKFKTQNDLALALEKLFLVKLKPLISKGLCASVYTQVSDVEEEINGLVTYDRKVIKVPISVMAKINNEIKLESEKVILK